MSSPDHSTIRAIAQEVAKAVVAESLMSGAREAGHREAVLVNLTSEVRSLRDEIKPLVVTVAQHSGDLERHGEMLATLQQSREEGLANPTLSTGRIRSIVQTEIQKKEAELVGEKKKSWAVLVPSVITSVVAAVVTAGIIGVFGLMKPDPPKPTTPPASSAPITPVPSKTP